MNKQYSQITFEFQDPPDSGENVGVGVRIKTLKKATEQRTQPAPEDNELPLDSSQQPQTEDVQQLANAESPDDVFDPGHNDNIKELVVIEEAVTGEEPADEIIPDTVKPLKSNRGRKSLKTIDEGTELINIPPDEELFKKQYYAIGEVAEMFHVNQSLLRFWETEFDIIQPRKNRKGDRHFRPVDIKNLLLIHDLLRRRKLTIEGAKDFLKKNKRTPERFAMIQSLQKIKGFILEVKATL